MIPGVCCDMNTLQILLTNRAGMGIGEEQACLILFHFKSFTITLHFYTLKI